MARQRHQKPDWQPYDPTWLVALARQQKPDQPGLAEALARCERAWIRSVAYTYFVDPVNANRHGAKWQVARNVMLQSPDQGESVLDVLKDGRIGGVEFLARVLEVD